MQLVIDLQAAQGDNRTRGIGRYCRELALAMVRQAGSHEVVIALNGSLSTEPLREAFAAMLPCENVRVWHGPGATGESLAQDPARRRAAEAMRAEFLLSLKPDLLHVGSIFEGWSDDVVTGWPAWRARLPFVATGHDLIPLIRRADYLDGAWAKGGLSRWYLRCLQELRLSDAILTNSGSTRDEMIEHLGSNPDRVFNISAGVGAAFKPPHLSPAERDHLHQRLGLRSDFILFLGGGDIRKNEGGLIRAYGLLPAGVRKRHQLVIVGKSDDDPLRSTARAAGIDPLDLVLIHFVNEADLPALYANCALFVLPSLHEGFGLPAAEAMACGAPVIASNTTSLPEVVGRDDALFDPSDPGAIAERMQAVLNDPAFRQELVSHAAQQSAKFTWSNSAARAWEGLEATHARLRPRSSGVPPSGWRLRLAYVSPVPPEQSGIADYSAELIPELARYYDITIVANVLSTTNENLALNFPVISSAQFLPDSDQFDRVLYHVGNSEFHARQLIDMLPRVPGAVTLHDAFLSGVVNWVAHHEGGGAASFTEELYRSHGWPATMREVSDGVHAAMRDFPCSLQVLQCAIGIIQHSQHGRDILATHFGHDATRGIRIIRHLRQRLHGPERRIARIRLGIPEDQFLVCSFGYVSPHKLPARLLAAWQNAAPAMVNARLVFVGQTDHSGARMLKAAAAELGQPLKRLWADYVDIGAYRAWLAAADVAVQLRTESRGETSGAILDCMAAGLATIINDHGSAAELPGDSVVRLPSGFTDVMLAEALLLLRDPTRRQLLATKAREYVSNELSPRRIAAEYHAAIEDAYADGHAAARRRTLRSLAYALPQDGGNPNMIAACARAMIRNFPFEQPRRLLIDASAYPNLQQGDSLGVLVMALLSTHTADIRVDLVGNFQGRWHYTRAKAASLLRLPRAPASDEPSDFAGRVALLCVVPPDGGYPAELDQLIDLHGAGVTLAVLLAGPPLATAQATICALASHVFCLHSADVAATNAWLDRCIPRSERVAVAVASPTALADALLRDDDSESRD